MSFESRKTAQFVQKFNNILERKNHKEKWRFSKSSSFLDKDKHIKKSRDKVSLDVREFIATLADHIFAQHHLAHPDLDCDAIEVKICFSYFLSFFFLIKKAHFP